MKALPAHHRQVAYGCGTGGVGTQQPSGKETSHGQAHQGPACGAFSLAVNCLSASALATRGYTTAAPAPRITSSDITPKD